MSDDDAFVAAVTESPDDMVLRLVYADWLDERDDPRGRFLRLDVEIRQRGESDPEYAALRQQLADVSAVVDPQWQRAMGWVRVAQNLWSPYDLGDDGGLDASPLWLEEQLRQQLITEDEPRQKAGRRWVWAYVGMLACTLLFLLKIGSVLFFPLSQIR